MKGIKKCEACNELFGWERSDSRNEPRFCSMKCRGHTGFVPGWNKNITPEKKMEHLKRSFEKHVIRKDGCWDWKGPIARNGYPVMSCKRSMGTDRGHRASYLIHIGEIPRGMHVCHKCDNPTCTNPDHLWIGTHRQNNDDKIEKGRAKYVKPPHKRGSENGSSKLKEQEVKDIKILLTQKIPMYKIGLKYGVSKTTVLRIKKGTHWRHVE